MKKMLFGLLALSLSASIFAATDSATMQVEAQLEVVPATADLVIENLTDAGGWNVVASPISFDHGKVVRGQTVVPTPVINENFRIRRSNNTPLPDGELDIRIGDFGGHTPNSTGTLTLAGQATPGVAPIPHSFRTIPAPVVIGVGTTAEVNFNIESRVDRLTGNEDIGAHRRLETVTVFIQ